MRIGCGAWGLGTILAFALQLTAHAAGDSASPADNDAAGVSSQENGSGEIQEVVVTARRREEALSKVPVSVTALSADQLAAKSIANENDLQSAVPGLAIRQNGSANAFNYVIRGQTIDTYTNSPPGVLSYTDDAQVVTHSASTFYDLANVQVLKGPQGTLFGRNTTGGAVLYQTVQPSAEREGYLNLKGGNFGAYTANGAINVPIADGIALRLAGLVTDGGAYIERLDTHQWAGDLQQRSLRASVLLEPMAGLKNTLVAQFTDDGGTNTPALIYHSSYFRCGNHGNGTTIPHYTDNADCGYAGYPYGMLPNASPYLALGVVGLADRQDQLGPYEVLGANTDLTHNANSLFVINTTQYSIGPRLDLKNIFMFNNSWSNEVNDYDGSSFPIVGAAGQLNDRLTSVATYGHTYYSKTRQYSEELQLQGEAVSSKLNYTVGLYYLNQTDDINSDSAAFDFYPLQVYGPDARTYVDVDYIQQSKDNSYATFAQATYALTDQLHLTGGARYTWEHITAHQLPGSIWYSCTLASCGTNGTSPFFEATTFSKPSWNFSLDYLLTPNLMAYVTTRGSWRAGGFNFTLPPNPTLADLGGNAFLPEKAQDVEVGVKYNGRVSSVPVALDIAIYNQWINDVQRGANYISPLTGAAVLSTVNVPSAEVSGVEGSLDVRPAEWLHVGGAIAYSNARYTSNEVRIPGNAPLFYGYYADVPKTSGSVFVELSRNLGPGRGKLLLRGDVYAQSLNYFSNISATVDPGSSISGYALLNARLTWDHFLGKSLNLAIFGRNLANKPYYTGGNGTGFSYGSNAAYPGVPRTFGGEVRFSF